ncbi:MAG: metallophosphoesterase [Desulfuromonadales bacterium]
MKLLILSDLHFEFEMPAPGVSTYTQTAQRDAMVETAKKADVIVLAGDTYTKGRGPKVARDMFSDKPIIMVAGNHEFYGQTYPHHLDKLQRQAAEIPGLHYLENQAVEIGDVVFLGCTLWTDCKLWESGPRAGLYSYQETIMDLKSGMNDYSRIKFFDGRRHRELLPPDLVKVHLDSVRWLRGQFEAYKGLKIVVVTHHAPSFRSVPETYQQDILSAAYASHLDELVEQSGALLWVHGHTHSQAAYQIGKTRVICNAKGYPEERTYFRPGLTVEI